MSSAPSYTSCQFRPKVLAKTQAVWSHRSHALVRGLAVDGDKPALLVLRIRSSNGAA